MAVVEMGDVSHKPPVLRISLSGSEKEIHRVRLGVGVEVVVGVDREAHSAQAGAMVL